MDTVTLLIVVVVVVVVIAAIAVAVSAMLRKRRSDRLREEFGPEYERTMRDSDDPRAAESDLRRREKQRKKIELRELDPRERDEYRDRWDSVQREFVDDPGRAVGKADRLVVDVMSARGYPAEDIDRRADDLSVDFPVITQRYREAREISRSHDAGRADTEDLRNAVTSYRSLVNALLDDADGERAGEDRRGLRDGAAPRDERDGARLDERDAGRGRDGDLARDADRDRDAARDGDTGRGRITDRDRDRDHDRDHDRDSDRDRNGDRADDRDGRRARDVVRDKISGRDHDGGRGRDAARDGDRDRAAADREPDAGHRERGRHTPRDARTDDDPRREATT